MTRLRPYVPAPEDITVSVKVMFDIRFKPDAERGGFSVTCRQLPEVAAHGATFTIARAAARRAITAAVEDRVDKGEFPRLRFVSPPRRSRELPRST